jgi:N-acetylmuramic acid 6-phosphate etherase
MQLSNNKLVDRGVRMIMGEIPVSYEDASEMLSRYGNVREAISNYDPKKLEL